MNLLNFLSLYTGHFKNSKKILFIGSIGLILALSIVSSTNYYFDNSKKSIIDNYFVADNPDNPNYADLVISLSYNPPFDNQIISTLDDAISQSQTDYKIDFFKSINKSLMISGLWISTSNRKDPNFPQYDSNASVTVLELDDDLQDELIKLNGNNAAFENSYLPKSDSSIPEVYVLNFNEFSNIDRSFSLINTSNIINAYDCINCGSSSINSYELNVTGMATLYPYEWIYPPNGTSYKNSDFDMYPAIQSLRYKSYAYNSYYPANLFLLTTNITKLSSLLKPITDSGYNNGYSYDAAAINTVMLINFDYSKIDPYNTGEIVSKVNRFQSRLYDKIYNQRSFNQQIRFSIYFYSQYKFDSINSILSSFIFTLFLVSLPVLIVTIFIINFSFGLIHKNVIRHIGVYKTRGATSRLIFSFQLLDNIIIIIFSSIAALIAGLPLSMLVLQTDYLLSFNYPAPSYYILNFRAIMDLLIYTALLLTFIVNFKRIFRLSRLSIVDTEQPVEREEPFWKRHYLDIILFSFGMVMYSTFYLLVTMPTTSNQGLGPIFGILVIFMIPAPFALVLGLILLINRIIPVILNKVGTILWDETGNLVAFSFKNVVRHKQAATRAVMLIAILISFMVFFYSLPYSLVLNNERTLYYTNGAEVVGSFDDSGYNETSLKIIQDNFSQYLEAFSPYVLASTQYIKSNGYSTILFINTTTYAKAAYLNFDLGLQNDLTKDLHNLKLSNTSDLSFISIIVNQQTLNDRNSNIGENITIIGESSTLNAQIIDSFRNWPILKQHFIGANVLGIADMGYFISTINQTHSKTPFSEINEQGVLFNFKDGVNQTLIASWIEGNTSIIITSLTAEAQKQFYTGIQFRLTVGQINNNVLMVIAISIIVLIMFAYLQLTERRKEIYTERALGMKLKQLASLFFIETIILSMTSVILGLGVGVFLMELLAMLILNPEQSYPAFEIIFPNELILFTITLILISSIIVSVLPAYYVTKQDISKSFGEM